MLFMEFYLPVIWGLLIATAVALYVLLDGFDLGVGILFPFTKDEDERDQMMNTIAPFWDGNETWLILGGGGLWVAFPKAYAILMPGVYIPIIVMLLALIFRGVAFEFRFISKPNHRWWDIAFAGGSTLAAFSQGVILGTVIQGLTIANNAYAGGPLDWLNPFAVMCGVGLVFGYAVLGSGWLMMRVVGPVASHARRWARPTFVVLLLFIAVVSVWTALGVPRVADRWFSAPMIYFIWPVPLVTLLLAFVGWRAIEQGHGLRTFAASVGLFLLCFSGLAISNYPYLLPPSLTVWDAAAAPDSQMFALLGAVIMLPIILAYTAFVYWTFRGKIQPGEGYH